VAGLQRDAPRDGSAVMHVQPNIVTDVMVEQLVNVSKRRREAKLLQLVIRRLAAERDAAPLDIEERFVEIPLRG
jgi:hypothetical protein